MDHVYFLFKVFNYTFHDLFSKTEYPGDRFAFANPTRFPYMFRVPSVVYPGPLGRKDG